MAKTAKDITSFKGGIINAVEPSDSEEEGTGSFESVNTDGIQKVGVLKPRGGFKAYSPVYDGINMNNIIPGRGFYVLQFGYNYDTSNLITSHVLDGLSISGVTFTDGDGTWVDSGSFVSWTSPTSTNAGSGSVQITDGAFALGKVYRYEIDRDPYSPGDNSTTTWITLDPACYTESWGADTIPMNAGRTTNIGYFKSNGVDPKFTVLNNASSGSASTPVYVWSIKFYEVLEPGAFEYQLVNREKEDAGEENVIELYFEGGNEDGTIGTPIDTIVMGPIGYGGTASTDFLFANNALRLYDADFLNKDCPNRFLGVQDTIFFKGCESGPDAAETSELGEAVSLETRRTQWIDELAKLEAPDPGQCRVICNGDMIAAWTDNPSNTAGVLESFHNYVSKDFSLAAGWDYFIGLEYAVAKHGITEADVTGTWNAAEDSIAPTLVEKGVRYKFYVTFMYDDGAQESEMVQIKTAQLQGKYWQGGTAPGFSNLPWTSGNIDAFVNSDDGGPGTSSYSDGNANTDGEIELYFHDGSTGEGGTITRFEDGGTGFIWCVSADHNLDVGYHVTITDTTNYNGADIVVAEVEQNRFRIPETYVSLAGESGVFAWDGRYGARKAWDCAVEFKPIIKPGESAGIWGFPERAMGIIYYYSTSNDGHNKKYKLIECDFVEGIKFHSGEATSYQPWKTWWIDGSEYAEVLTAKTVHYFYSHSEVVGNNPGGYVSFKDPPQIEDWETMYDMKSENWHDIRWKTAVIIGSQAYYGNVKVGENEYKDRILVSISNHGYDMIPDDNYLEVVSGDGDEIVLLLTYKDQLFVFKKRSLVICTVGGEDDSVTDTLQVGGIDTKSQACTTSKGVFWANSFGAFLHDGSELTNLTRGKIALAESNVDQIDIQVDEEAIP